jgi:hypothetical protein
MEKRWIAKNGEGRDLYMSLLGVGKWFSGKLDKVKVEMLQATQNRKPDLGLAQSRRGLLLEDLH